MMAVARLQAAKFRTGLPRTSGVNTAPSAIAGMNTKDDSGAVIKLAGGRRWICD